MFKYLNCAKHLNDYNYRQCNNNKQINAMGGKVSANKF